ncbi:MAG: FtsW/RodA/SpoVE family cell cycle protein, partial [Finegoldia magna]|nr:FtsW/RodA/SpoVE family cell cycle protein [Finegoldia magna]
MKNISKIDKTLIISVLILVIYGLVVLYSAGSSLSNHYFRKQLIATIIGIIVVFFIISLDNHIIKKLNIPMYIICNVLLVLVLFFGVGDEWGARSWFKFGPINFQPSEIMKIVLIISLANIIESNKNSLNNPKTLLKILIFAFIPVALILKQPDAGTAMVYTFIIIVMLFTAGIDWKYLIGAIILGIVSLPFLYLRLDQFQRDRILNFVHPERDLSNTGWQALQGKIAIGSGKLTGEGFLNGVQSQYNFIPEKQTDFIFAVLVE